MASCSCFYVSRRTLLRQQRFQNERNFLLGQPIEAERLETSAIQFSDTATMKLNPIEPGFVHEMAEDGSYLANGTDDILLMRQPSLTNQKTYVVCCPDGERKIIEAGLRSEVQLLPGGDISILQIDSGSASLMTIMKKEAKDRWSSSSYQGNSIWHHEGNERFIPGQTNRPVWIDTKTGQEMRLDRLGNSAMNRDHEFVQANNDKVQFGRFTSYQEFSAPKSASATKYHFISPGTNPKRITSFISLYDGKTYFYEVRGIGLTVLPISSESRHPFVIALGSKGDVFMTDEKHLAIVRVNGKWTDLTKIAGLKLARGTVDWTGNRRRFLFEEGVTLINHIRNGRNWITRLEVSD